MLVSVCLGDEVFDMAEAYQSFSFKKMKNHMQLPFSGLDWPSLIDPSSSTTKKDTTEDTFVNTYTHK